MGTHWTFQPHFNLSHKSINLFLNDHGCSGISPLSEPPCQTHPSNQTPPPRLSQLTFGGSALHRLRRAF
jgi:hypothetical protein